MIDLHVHTFYSADSASSIDEILSLFSEGDIVGINDHETIGGWEGFKKKSQAKGVIPVFAVEWFCSGEHLSAYFQYEDNIEFINFMRSRRCLQKKMMQKICLDLEGMQKGFSSYDELLVGRVYKHPDGVLGMKCLIEEYCNVYNCDYAQAKNDLRDISSNYEKGVERPFIYSPEEIIHIFLEFGGIPILMHPYRNGRGGGDRKNSLSVERSISIYKEAGLKGVEVYSGDTREVEMLHLCSLCKRQGLYPSIGSDYHDVLRGEYNRSALQKANDAIGAEVNSWLKKIL